VSNPKNILARELIAENYRTEKKLDLAIDELSTALKDFPNEAELYYRRALMYKDANKLEPAISDLKKCVGGRLKDPRIAARATELAALLVDAKQYKSAIQTADQIIAEKPSGSSYRSRACANWYLGNKKEAIDDMQKAADSFYQEARIIRRDRAIADLKLMKEGQAPSIVDS
jgi:tetratricopeptide (TPR) repeat protein